MNRKKTWSILLSAAIVLGTGKMSFAETDLPAYRELVARYEAGEYNGFAAEDLRYGLFYIDNDEIPELAVRYPQGGIELYTVVDGEAIRFLYTEDDFVDTGYQQMQETFLYYNEEKNAITCYANGEDAGDVWQLLQLWHITYDGSVVRCSEEASSDGKVWSMYGKEVPEEQVAELFLPEGIQKIEVLDDAQTVEQRLSGVLPVKGTEQRIVEETENFSEGGSTEDAVSLAEQVISALKENEDKRYVAFYSRTEFDIQAVAAEDEQVTLKCSAVAPNIRERKDDYWIQKCHYYLENQETYADLTDENAMILFEIPMIRNAELTNFSGEITVSVNAEDAFSVLYSFMDVLANQWPHVMDITEDEFDDYYKQAYRAYFGSDAAIERGIDQFMDDAWDAWMDGNTLNDSLKYAAGGALESVLGGLLSLY